MNEFDGLVFDIPNPAPIANVIPGMKKMLKVSGLEVRASYR